MSCPQLVLDQMKCRQSLSGDSHYKPKLQDVLQSQARMVSWFKAKHKLFNVNSAGMITLKFALRTPRPTQAEVPAPPGFAPGRKPGHNWQGPAPSHNATDHRLALLEEKIIKWLSKRHQVTTTEMAEFAYSAHEDLVPGKPWIFCNFCLRCCIASYLKTCTAMSCICIY